MRERLNAKLVESAWRMAVINRHPPAQLLHHSDRGSQYTSEAYWNLLQAAQCQISMSRTGNCYDNAAMESFFATLKGECANRRFSTKTEAQSAIFEYIEVWYNRQRLHSSLGYLKKSGRAWKPSPTIKIVDRLRCASRENFCRAAQRSDLARAARSASGTGCSCAQKSTALDQ